MDSANLVRMANRIGEFFEAMPERDEALHGIAEHIRKFWEPRMRAELARVLASPDEAQALKPIVREALALHPLPPASSPQT
ncbi:MAG: formate dehydrogenase subunit delta [Delftia acidovorans]|jgi:formate dehydrogenase subunit delta|uniref:formate dehydrogenase subunit delta n=1 Tax=Delftia acidovorans TaxID=80866 RepID=UPI00282468C7|nr:formate dehydrogenase subunit delta [Delftia acidovorans]MDR3018978.1 formate dehydrogenase subunit delta [Delftia acidovorans]